MWRYGWLLALFSVPLVAFVVLKAIQPGVPPALDPTGLTHPRWGLSPLGYVDHQWFAIFGSVLLFGALGATISFFARVETIDRGLIRSKTVNGTQLFGAVFATILFLIFLGGLVQGSLFPDLQRASRWNDLFLDLTGWAKLMVWCFVAGFSERFVPDMLMTLIQGSRRSGADPAD